MVVGPTVFVTRPAADAATTVAALHAAGVAATATPLLEIAFGAAPTRVEANEALIFTSANGVRAFAAAGSEPGKAFVVGPATDTAARAAGHNIAGMGGGDVETLLPLLLQAPPDMGLVHICGADTTGALVPRLALAGRRARRLTLYSATPVAALPLALGAAMASGGHGIGLFSPRTARILGALTLASARAGGAAAAFSATDFLCLSEAVAAAAPAGARRVTVARRPEIAAFVDMAKSWAT